jgi:hypothetical protein
MGDNNDDINNVNEPIDELNEEEHDFDEDFVVDDYEGQNDGVINKINEEDKEKKEKEDDDLFELNNANDFERKFTSHHLQVLKKSSGYPIISSFEYTKLYGLITEYIVNNKFSVPKEMEELEVVKSGDAFRIAMFWLNNRKTWPIPMELMKNLHGRTVEMVDPNKLETHDDLAFHDDDNDEYRFDWNFHDEPYDTAA